jgi:hypothetical protein
VTFLNVRIGLTLVQISPPGKDRHQLAWHRLIACRPVQ